MPSRSQGGDDRARDGSGLIGALTRARLSKQLSAVKVVSLSSVVVARLDIAKSSFRLSADRHDAQDQQHSVPIASPRRAWAFLARRAVRPLAHQDRFLADVPRHCASEGESRCSLVLASLTGLPDRQLCFSG